MAPERSAAEETARIKRGVTRAAGFVGLATFLSRITGFVRDMVIAHFFGAREVADAFFMAFRIPNMLRRYTAEGALTAAWVPVFSSRLAKSREEAFVLANNVLSMLAIITFLFAAAGMAAAPWLVMAIAPGFLADAAKFGLTVDLTRVMFPFCVFISLAAGLMGMANTMGAYFVPAAAPILLNLAVIACAVIFHDWFSTPAMSLAVGVLLGGLLQVAWQYAQVSRLGYSYRPSLDHRDEDTKKVGTLMAPAALGMAAVEINLLVGGILASFLPHGAVSYLYYGNRVVTMPSGIIGASFSLATLPAMSKEAAGGGLMGRLVEIFSHSMRVTLLVTVPAMAALLALSEPITNLLFERGEFDQLARLGSAHAMAMYAIGLPAITGLRLVANSFYAMKDTSTPAKVAGWCVLANVGLSFALVGPMAHGGLALATSLASWLNMGVLIYLLRRRLGKIEGRKIAMTLAKVSVSAAFMVAFVIWYAGAYYSYSAGTMVKTLHMGITVTMGLAVYFAALRLLKCEEIYELWDMAASKISRMRGK